MKKLYIQHNNQINSFAWINLYKLMVVQIKRNEVTNIKTRQAIFLKSIACTYAPDNIADIIRYQH